MAFQDMINELRGQVPKLPYLLCPTLINRAWKEIRERNLWSFLLAEAQWITPGQVNTGTATTIQGSSIVQLDATATTAIQASLALTNSYSPIILRQFRIAAGGIYSIYQFNITGPTSNLVLDRAYGEASATNSAYSIYQAYYPSPMSTEVVNGVSSQINDFLRFVSVRDMVNFIDLIIDKTREELDAQDPQRTWYYFPTWVVPYKPDPRPLTGVNSSPTSGVLLHELWGAPTYSINYQLLYIRRGNRLINPTDTLPYSIGEDVVIEKAKYYAYEWAEANKGMLDRNQGPDYRFLMGSSVKRYDELLKNYRKQDRELVDNFFTKPRTGLYGQFWAGGYYSTLSGTAKP